MTRKRLVLPFLVTAWVLTAFALALVCGPAQAEDVPKIGIIYPKTGIYSSLGPMHFDGLMMAIEDHGLLLGKKPKLFIRDSGTKAALAMSAAQELINKERVNIIIGAINTPINNSLATLADQHKIPFIYPSGGSILMSGIGKDTPHPQGVIKANPHPYMFYTWLNSVQRGYACLDVAELKGKRWYFVATDYDHGREAVGYAQKTLRDKYGKAFVDLGVSWAKQGEVDYTSAITKAMSLKPDVVFVCVPGRFVQFQKQAASMGLKDKAHIHWSYGERISASAAGEAAYGVTATVDYSVENPKWPLSNQFAQRFYKKYKYWPGWPASSTYAGVQIFLMGVEKAKSLSGPKIMRALQGLSNPKSITGPPYFIRACDQKSVQPLYTVQWTKSDTYKPGYWKILKAYAKPADALLPCGVKAGYDKMKY
ncbi:MAG: ABC transporter substrate-binding protein [Desulfarculus sp.]|jgi:branched-chain amino acid transport system substrate-binding protein|nr:MAG: ABC transporter substrate-binding protein [Desulfarculus sp.]